MQFEEVCKPYKYIWDNDLKLDQQLKTAFSHTSISLLPPEVKNTIFGAKQIWIPILVTWLLLTYPFWGLGSSSVRQEW